MAKNFPGPYVVTFEYTAPIGALTLTHEHSVNCAVVGTPAVGTPASSILVSTLGGSTKALNTAIDEYWAFLRLAFSTTSVVSQCILWSITPSSYERNFITAYTLVPAAGSDGAAPANSREVTCTFRSGKGSTMQINVQESVDVFDTKTALISNAGGQWYQRVSAYVLSTGGWITARDRSFPVAPLNVAGTQNEHTYKKRFRPS